jgi:hypothetical protein
MQNLAISLRASSPFRSFDGFDLITSFAKSFNSMGNSAGTFICSAEKIVELSMEIIMWTGDAEPGGIAEAISAKKGVTDSETP